MSHQHQSGGWDYLYAKTGQRKGDTSVTLWQLQALNACKYIGLWDEKFFKPHHTTRQNFPLS